jgi:hypothetical protein
MKKEENVNHTQTQNLKPYFEFYVDGKLVNCGSLKEVARKVTRALNEGQPLKIDSVQFQASKEKPRRFRLLILFTLFDEIEGECTYQMTHNQMFDLVQSVAKALPNERATLMEACG